jgi:hypothetical protein
LSRVVALATVLTAIAIASGTVAGSGAEPAAKRAVNWIVRGTAEGNVRIKTSEGIVLEAHQIRFQLPPGTTGDVRGWCSITGQPDESVIMLNKTSGANGKDTLRTKALAISFHANSFECRILSAER